MLSAGGSSSLVVREVAISTIILPDIPADTTGDQSILQDIHSGVDFSDENLLKILPNYEIFARV